jgi:hypothetical protein
VDKRRKLSSPLLHIFLYLFSLFLPFSYSLFISFSFQVSLLVSLLFPFAPIFLPSLRFLHLISFPPPLAFLPFLYFLPSFLPLPPLTCHYITSRFSFSLPFVLLSSFSSFFLPVLPFISPFHLFFLFLPFHIVPIISFPCFLPFTFISSFSSLFVFFFLPATNGVERDGKTDDVFYLCPQSETPRPPPKSFGLQNTFN